MPTYLLRCPDCDFETEWFGGMSEDLPYCPQCPKDQEKTNEIGPISRLVKVPAGVGQVMVKGNTKGNHAKNVRADKKTWRK